MGVGVGGAGNGISTAEKLDIPCINQVIADSLGSEKSCSECSPLRRCDGNGILPL
jgi:hypothetical protein